MRSCLVRGERSLVIPSGNHGEMIRAGCILLEDVITKVARIVAALRRLFLEQSFRFLSSRGWHIDVSDDVEAPRPGIRADNEALVHASIIWTVVNLCQRSLKLSRKRGLIVSTF